MKRCTDCLKVKDESEFHKSRFIHSECKVCHRKRCRKYYYKHREHLKAWQRQYNKDNPGKIYEITHRYMAKDPDRWREYAKEHSKRYYKKNKEMISAKAKAKRAKLKMEKLNEKV